LQNIIELRILKFYNVNDCHDELQAYLRTHEAKIQTFDDAQPIIKLHNEEPPADEVMEQD